MSTASRDRRAGASGPVGRRSADKKLIDEDADDAGSQIASVYALRKEPEKMFSGWTTPGPPTTAVQPSY